MKEKDKRPTYEPPQAKDISASSVSGQVTPGACKNGNLPRSPVCRPGSAPPACINGAAA